MNLTGVEAKIAEPGAFDHAHRSTDARCNAEVETRTYRDGRRCGGEGRTRVVRVAGVNGKRITRMNLPGRQCRWEADGHAGIHGGVYTAAVGMCVKIQSDIAGGLSMNDGTVIAEAHAEKGWAVNAAAGAADIPTCSERKRCISMGVSDAVDALTRACRETATEVDTASAP